MGSVHIPRLGRFGRAGVAVAVLAAMAVVGGGVQHAAAAGAPYGGTAAAVPGTIEAANYDTGGQGVAYNVTSTNGTGTEIGRAHV